MIAPSSRPQITITNSHLVRAAEAQERAGRSVIYLTLVIRRFTVSASAHVVEPVRALRYILPACHSAAYARRAEQCLICLRPWRSHTIGQFRTSARLRRRTCAHGAVNEAMSFAPRPGVSYLSGLLNKLGAVARYYRLDEQKAGNRQ